MHDPYSFENAGQIFFSHDGEPAIFLEIRQGRFEGQVKPGKTRVEIRRYEINKPPPQGANHLPPSKKNILPPQYNDNSQLSAEVQFQETKEYIFKIKSK